ncbi:hypothetical protein [Ewingella americana]|uniref:Uncharacterized protein n=1 Tax=Ewingella americana TaxID=41202 RepID=A0A502GD62_9GAMM|nr:hypothetical protein [Ewingella americana]TPG60039.1 hypothetical protein EAH77_15845 [Ewingella americana]
MTNNPITELQKSQAADYTDSLKRAISVVASRGSALVWPLEEVLQFNSEYYNSICASLANIAFSRNPAALKRDESIIVLVEIDLATFESDTTASPEGRKQAILDMLKRNASVLFKSLSDSRNCSGGVIILGSSAKMPKLTASQLAACFETSKTDIYSIESQLDYDLALKSGWKPQHILSVGLNAMTDIEMMQYRALQFNSNKPINLPMTHEHEAEESLLPEDIKKSLEPQPIKPLFEDLPNNPADFNDDLFAPNPLFASVEAANTNLSEDTRNRVAAQAKQTLLAEQKPELSLISLSIPVKLKDQGDYTLLLRANYPASLEEGMSPTTSAVWSDESFLAFSCQPLALSQSDTMLSGAYSKVVTHVSRLDIASAAGSAYESIVGIELSFKDYLKSFIIPEYSNQIIEILEQVYTVRD